MKEKKIKYLKEQVAHLKYYNRLAPFPIYDTEDIIKLEKEIMSLEKENKVNYNDEPVVACMYCNSLNILIDDVDNSICGRCGSVNELKEYKNIFEYKNNTDGKDK